MKGATIAQALCLAVLTTAACNQRSEEAATETNATAAEEEQAAESINIEDMDSAELPPMIVRSPAYRCSDGNALYVDVLSDENAVTVRDSRSDIPVRLTRDAPGEPFTDDGRTLSGTGTEVRYSSPERPSQVCREGAA